MSQPMLPGPDASPFDSIRRGREDGTEYWSGRELMPVMGYGKWQAFLVPIERAMKTAQNQGADLGANFTGSRKVAASGPDAADFELSRFAAYLVAMNGDPNKAEVAAAQAYFAIQTRVAETAPVPLELTEDQIVAQALAITTRKVAALTEQVAELTPPAKAWNHLAGAAGDYSVSDAAKILSRDPFISIGRDRLFAFMADQKWIFRHRGKRPGWEAYQTAVDAARLFERPATPFLNSKTGDYELPAPTIRITVKGIQKLHELLGGIEALPAIDAA